MRFWIRELFGWLLVLAGMYVFLVVYAILVTPGPQLLEAGPLTVVGIIIFRGGIHLLKVAMAARICLHAEAEISRQQLAAADSGRAGSAKKPLPLDW